MESTTTIIVFWMHQATLPSRFVLYNFVTYKHICDTFNFVVGVIKLRIALQTLLVPQVKQTCYINGSLLQDSVPRGNRINSEAK